MGFIKRNKNRRSSNRSAVFIFLSFKSNAVASDNGNNCENDTQYNPFHSTFSFDFMIDVLIIAFFCVFVKTALLFFRTTAFTFS